jgi:hypothetical protein
MHITSCIHTAPVVALVSAGPWVAWAQARPDFSGEWVLNRQERNAMGNHDAVWIYDRR